MPPGTYTSQQAIVHCTEVLWLAYLLWNMRYFLLALTLSPLLCNAQTEERAVLDVVDRFFQAMTARDTTAMTKVIRRDGVLFATRPGSGRPAQRMSHEEYLINLTKGSERLLERIWEPVVRVDEDLATVTAPYDFHVDGTLSHCGTDVFTLMKDPDGWRISGGIFTMRKGDCQPSPLGPVMR